MNSSVPLPTLAVELTLASWEAVLRRSWLMASGRCSPAEYLQMATEKMQAVQESGRALAQPWGAGTINGVIAPWHGRATANARRLRGS